MNAFSYWNSDKMVLRMHGAQEVDAQSAPEYYDIVRQLAATQHDLYRRYRALLDGGGTEEDDHSLRMQEVQQFNRFSQALAAARTDSYEVWEVRAQWVRIEAQAKELMVTLERWLGWPTLRGSRAIDPSQPWDEDAPATARLREQGDT